LLGLDYAAKQIGFETLCAKVSLLQLCKDTPLPCIIHWNKGRNHTETCWTTVHTIILGI